jgi:hypothetical protein
MFNLLLVGMFTAFFIAIMEPFRDLLTIVASRRAVNAFLFLLFSFLATFILEPEFNTKLIVKVISGAFLGSFLTLVTERVSTYQAAVVRAVGQER